MKKMTRIGTVSVLTLVVALAFSAVAEQLPIGAADAMDGGDTRDVGASVTYTASGDNGLTVAFGAGSFPPSGAVRAMVVVDQDIPDSPFTGDLIAAAINTLQFKISGDGSAPNVARVLLNYNSADHREWRVDFAVSRTPGEVVTIDLPLTLDAGWTTEWPGNKDAMFAEDLQDIQSVMIRLTPGDPDGIGILVAQAYTVSDAVVINDDGISSPPGALTALEEALIGNFGYGYGSVDSLTGDMKQWDADGDGMVDYVELWAENDEDYANSIFAAEDIAIVADGVEITWVCVAGETYSVLRSETMYGAFSAVSALSGLVADETGYMTQKDVDTAVVDGEGPFFYRIKKD
ncbi:MAG: hypothetical protein QGH15_07070 [Kiritimatiellia bacterium]|jgi:hypothetical protein|nr:hypothetical protein [Kiritimatiellia bacterium]